MYFFLRLRPSVVLVSLALMALGAQAQPTTTATPTLSSMVITATGFEQEIKDAPASISVITREELEKKPFRDLTDALRDVEGVTITGVANEQDIYIRGLPGAYTLILVDGIRQSTRDARTNGNSGFEQSFIPPRDAIERIEVVRGPMSSLYGSDAMGGVINIITRKVPKEWGGSLGIDYTLQEHGDSGDSHQEQFYLGGPIKDEVLGLQVWGRQHRRSEDGLLNGYSGAKDRDLTARLAIRPNIYHDILLEAGTTQVSRNANPGGTLDSTAAATSNDNDRDHYSLSHNGRYGWGASQISFSREQAQRTNFTRNASGMDVANARSPKIKNTLLDAKLTVPLGNHLVVMGGQWREGRLTDQNPGRRTGVDEQFSIEQKALFLEDEWRLTERWALTGGLRLDDHSEYGQHWSPRLYSVWHTTDNLSIKGGVSRGFKAPELRTIAPGYAYTTGGGGCSYGANGTCGVIIGDPNLKPEASTSYEVAALWDNKAGLTASATLFYTDFKDKVANSLVYQADGVTPQRWAEDPNYRLWYSYNIDNATIAGTELSMRWQANKQLSLKSGYTYTDSRQNGGTYDGYALARTPKHAFNLRADWVAMPGLTLWSALNYSGKQINAGARVGSNGALVTTGVREYDAYSTADIGASYEIDKNKSVSLALYNLSDKRLNELNYNTVGDGRRLYAGLNIQF